MVFLETPIFTKRVNALVPDEDYRAVQFRLSMQPDAGRLIPGSSGLRKIRWSGSQKGKRGGTRFLYYWVASEDKILMLMVFSKSEKEDLTKDQLRMLRRLVLEELG